VLGFGKTRVALPQCFFRAFAFRHIDICADHLDKLSVGIEQMMALCRQIFDCPTGKYNFELARAIFFLAHCLLDLFPDFVSIVDPFPQRVAAWKALQRFKPQIW
jgi:hypothetical protein